MRSPPRGSDEVVTVAIPFVIAPVPNRAEPLVNVTVPVTLPDSVSVKVTEAPGREGLTEEVRLEEGLALATVWVAVPTAEL